MRFFLLSLFLFLILPLLSQEQRSNNNEIMSDASIPFSYQLPAKTLGKKWMSFETRYSLWNSSDVYYDEDGSEGDHVANFSYTQHDLLLNLAYGVNHRFDMFAELNARRNSYEGLAGTTTKSLEKEGVDSYRLGARYMIPYKTNTWFLLEASFKQTAYGVPDYDANKITLGDPGSEFFLKGVVSHRTRNYWFNSFGMGVRFPSREQSTELTYDAQTAVMVWRLALIGGVSGVKSLKSDGYENDPQNKPPLDGSTSKMFNSINREWMSPYVGMNIGLSKQAAFDIRLRQVIDGVSTDKGREVAASFRFLFAGEDEYQERVGQYKEYVVEGRVTKVSARGKFVRVDKGITDNVEKGMRFDLYEFDYLGGNVLIASGVVFESEADWSIIRVERIYREKPIEIGLVARGY